MKLCDKTELVAAIHAGLQQVGRPPFLSKYRIGGSGDGRSKRAQTSGITVAPVRAAIAWLSVVLPAALAPSRQMTDAACWGRRATRGSAGSGIFLLGAYGGLVLQDQADELGLTPRAGLAEHVDEVRSCRRH